jgi:hypothetical protein
MRNTADVTGGKPIAVWLQSISGVSAINPLVAFYDIQGGKRENDNKMVYLYIATAVTIALLNYLQLLSELMKVYEFACCKQMLGH